MLACASSSLPNYIYAVCIILLSQCCSFASSTNFDNNGETFFVSTFGNDSTGNGSYANPFRGLEKAIFSAGGNNVSIVIVDATSAMPYIWINTAITLMLPNFLLTISSQPGGAPVASLDPMATLLAFKGEGFLVIRGLRFIYPSMASKLEVGAAGKLIVEDCEFTHSLRTILLLSREAAFARCYFAHNGQTGLDNFASTVTVLAGKVQFSDCVFHNNSARFAAAIGSYPGATLSLENCTFTYNRVLGEMMGSLLSMGGAMQILSVATINSCVFIGNEASSGGAVSVSGNGNVSVTNCRFEDNSAHGPVTGYGGAVSVTENGIASLQYSNFSGNSAVAGGCGSSTAQGILVFEHCQFTNNSASGAGIGGGAIVLAAVFPSVFRFCNFYNNSAESGGAVSMFALGQGRFISVLFDHNKATQNNGGAVNMIGTISSYFLNVTFYGNTAAFWGGAIAGYEAAATYAYCLFLGNYLGSPHSGLGGAVYTTGAMDFYSCMFTMNVGAEGGAIYASGIANVTIVGCQITLCLANQGAAITSVNSAMLTMDHCEIYQNEAIDQGVIEIDTQNRSMLTGTKFHNNKNGVVVTANSGDTLMMGCEFVDNVAVSASIVMLSNSGGATSFVDCVFTNNTAQDDQGYSQGVVMTVAASTGFYSTIFSNNVGGCLVALAPVNISGCSFVNNSVSSVAPLQYAAVLTTYRYRVTFDHCAICAGNTITTASSSSTSYPDILCSEGGSLVGTLMTTGSTSISPTCTPSFSDFWASPLSLSYDSSNDAFTSCCMCGSGSLGFYVQPGLDWASVQVDAIPASQATAPPYLSMVQSGISTSNPGDAHNKVVVDLVGYEAPPLLSYQLSSISDVPLSIAQCFNVILFVSKPALSTSTAHLLGETFAVTGRVYPILFRLQDQFSKPFPMLTSQLTFAVSHGSIGCPRTPAEFTPSILCFLTVDSSFTSAPRLHFTLTTTDGISMNGGSVALIWLGWLVMGGVLIGAGLLVLVVMYGHKLWKIHRTAVIDRLLKNYVGLRPPSADNNEELNTTSSAQVMVEKQLVIPFSELQILRDVAIGSTGKVMLARWRRVEVAVKQFFGVQKEFVDLFLQECQTHYALRHPNVVQLLAVCRQPMSVVMEWIERGSLFSLLQDEGTKLEWTLRLNIGIETAAAMHYLHSCGIMHRDLKSLNILIDHGWHAKIADLGEARSLSTKHTAEVRGTLMWAAPEVLEGKGMYTEKVDVFSFGCVMFELWTRKLPYSTNKGAPEGFALIDYILQGGRPEFLQNHPAPSWYNALAQDCWQANPERRPDFGEILHVLERNVPFASKEPLVLPNDVV